MSIDIRDETLIPFQEAPRHIPGKPHLSTIHRWRLTGVRGGIKLETCLVGGRRYTSLEALQRFSNSVTSAADGGGDLRDRPSRQRERLLEEAEAELNRSGI